MDRGEVKGGVVCLHQYYLEAVKGFDKIITEKRGG